LPIDPSEAIAYCFPGSSESTQQSKLDHNCDTTNEDASVESYDESPFEVNSLESLRSYLDPDPADLLWNLVDEEMFPPTHGDTSSLEYIAEPTSNWNDLLDSFDITNAITASGRPPNSPASSPCEINEDEGSGEISSHTYSTTTGYLTGSIPSLDGTGVTPITLPGTCGTERHGTFSEDHPCRWNDCTENFKALSELR
jgi:hypothetical protein